MTIYPPAITGNVAGDTVAQRAAQSGASERTQRMADTVAKKAPELAQPAEKARKNRDDRKSANWRIFLVFT